MEELPEFTFGGSSGIGYTKEKNGSVCRMYGTNAYGSHIKSRILMQMIRELERKIDVWKVNKNIITAQEIGTDLKK